MVNQDLPRLKHDYYGLSHYICPADVRLIDFLNVVAACGFAGVGITERALEEMPIKVLQHELKARGLSVTSVNSAGYFLYESQEKMRKQVERNRWLIDCSAELQAGGLNVIVGGMGHGVLTLERSRQRAVDALTALHLDVSSVGVKIIVEPVHPFAVWSKGCLNSLRQVENAISGMSMASINVDLFHSWWDPDLVTFINRADSPFGMFQICDVGDFAADGTPHRVPLGEGVVDLSLHLNAFLKRISRPVIEIIEVELFATQLPGRPLIDLLSKTVNYLNALGTNRDIND